MSDAWFANKLAPDGDPTDGCHPEEAQALQAYLDGRLPAEAAARALTRPVATSADPQGDLPRLYGLLEDALLELPAAATATGDGDDGGPLLDLLAAMEAQPAPDFAAVAEARRPAHGTLWRGLPGFGHGWADGVVGDRQQLEGRDGRGRDADEAALVARCARRAEFEAWLVRRGLAGLDLSGGYECVTAALERSRAPLHAAVPMACAWLGVAGALFRDGAARRDRSWALERDGDLWRSEAAAQGGEDPKTMSPARWDFWIRRLRTIADDDKVSPWARDAARQCLGILE